MTRWLRWIGWALGSLAALAVVAYVGAYLRSEQIMTHRYATQATAVAIPTDAASIAEGRRLAIIRGCFGGCHGKEAEGAVMFDDPMIARIVAPNLTAATRKYTDAELVGIIRHGVRPDGRSMLVMPAEEYGPLNDADLGRIIAFIKSLPVVEGPGPGVALGPLGRVGVAVGQFKPVAEMIARTVPPPEATGEIATLGRYLARTTCTSCHGTSLTGDSNPEFTSPTLAVVAAYSPEAFTQLMRNGVALGGRTMPTMSPWARQHLKHLTDEEIAALYSYLHDVRL